MDSFERGHLPSFPVPHDEERRLAALRAIQILDTPPEEAFDGLTRAAAAVCGTPTALVVLVDKERQWFKSRVGESRAETPRSTSFCAHAIMNPSVPLVVPDATLDDRFTTNPEVASGRLRFYAGFPMVTTDGQAVGSLCVIDTIPRVLSPEQMQMTAILAAHAAAQLELRRKVAQLEMAEARERALVEELASKNGELARLDLVRAQFVSNAVHELNNPLTVLNTLLFILMDDRRGALPADQHDYLKKAEAQLQRFGSLVQDLRDAARVESGRLSVAPALTSIAEIVRDAAETYAESAEKNGLAFAVRLETDREVLADGGRIAQVLQNLVGNAIKFTPAGGRVEVHLHESGNGIQVDVRDTGPGLTADQAAKLFQPFSQVHESLAAKGSGLGLYICKGIIEQHGGRIWVESEGPDRGSVFRFTLATT